MGLLHGILLNGSHKVINALDQHPIGVDTDTDQVRLPLCATAANHSATQSLPQSLSHSVTPSVTQSLSHSLSHSISHSVTPSLPQSLSHSVTQPLSHSVTPLDVPMPICLFLVLTSLLRST